ncbi:MAG: arginase [Nitratireductor sp.]|nr:arginase [Nitratireductor sp.]
MFVGAPVQVGASQPGCLMGPDALRTAGICEAIAALGYKVSDAGNVTFTPRDLPRHPNPAIHDLEAVSGWIEALAERAHEKAREGVPVFLGGDHSLSAGTIAGVARAARDEGRPLYVLWLDAHPDVHTLDTTSSGNLHGTPLAYLTGEAGFKDWYPPLEVAVDPSKVCLLGLRSVDRDESAKLIARHFTVHDMRSVDEHGIVSLVRNFAERAVADNGWLHISLDVDFLDPEVAPAVGTTVPGGATVREAHLIMELLHECGAVRSLDLVELNPFLDVRGRTAKLLVDLTSSLFGKTILDRKTRSY